MVRIIPTTTLLKTGSFQINAIILFIWDILVRYPKLPQVRSDCQGDKKRAGTLASTSPGYRRMYGRKNNLLAENTNGLL
jgi:hypothetical protein